MGVSEQKGYGIESVPKYYINDVGWGRLKEVLVQYYSLLLNIRIKSVHLISWTLHVTFTIPR